MKSNMLIPIFLHPDGAYLWYFKLRILDLTWIHGLKYLRSTTLCCKDIEIRKLEFVTKTQFLYTTSLVWLCDIAKICFSSGISILQIILEKNIIILLLLYSLFSLYSSPIFHSSLPDNYRKPWIQTLLGTFNIWC